MNKPLIARWTLLAAALAMPLLYSADSQKEKDLAAKLAAAEARLAALAGANNTAAQSRANLASHAAVNAENAQNTADVNAAEAKKVAEEAKAQMEKLKEQIATATKEEVTRQNEAKDRYVLLITGGFAFLGLLVPLLALIITNRGKHQERMDEIELAKVGKELGAKLDQIHTLVNSNLTASMQAQLDALRVSLAATLELGVIREKAGLMPSEDALEAVAETKRKIAELESQLEDRLHATDAASAELAKKMA